MAHPQPTEPSSPSPSGAPTRRHEVPADRDGERLDRILTDLVPDTSRSRLAAWIKDGAVRVSGSVVERPSHPVRAGDVLEFEPPGELRRAGGTDPIRILFEDEHVILLDKPAGVVCHPSDAIAGGTVSEQLVERYGDLPDPHAAAARAWAEREDDDEALEEAEERYQPRPGIVHRLDARTSGVMIAARSEAAGVRLLEMFAQREVSKTYHALVHGEPRFISDWIESPIQRDPRRPDRMSIAPDGKGRAAETFYETLERFGLFALVAAHPRTGRTHQIRVHLESIDLPIVGDTVYTSRRRRKSLPKEAPKLARQALHAAKLELAHPITGEPLVAEAPLANDMQALLEWLRAARPSD